MPAELPANPNLQHLRKQAKALLRDFRKNTPGSLAKFSALNLKTQPALSHAQLLVAREYGFDSWSRLKEHVDSVSAETVRAVELARKAFRKDDAQEFRRLLDQYPVLKTKDQRAGRRFRLSTHYQRPQPGHARYAA